MRDIVTVKNLVKSYKSGGGELVVLRGLDLVVHQGEFLSITGRSGSGKSTLLYQLGLLDRPNTGEIIINGVDVSELDGEEQTQFRLKELGYVFQDYALIPEFTALENVMIPLLMQNLTHAESAKKGTAALEKMGLGDKLHNVPSQLSGGMQQRVSVARAIAHEPKIIFADEPTANLDADTADNVLDAFLELHRAGQTIVMVTHEPEYSALTDRILLLADGIISSEEWPKANGQKG